MARVLASSIDRSTNASWGSPGTHLHAPLVVDPSRSPTTIPHRQRRRRRKPAAAAETRTAGTSPVEGEDHGCSDGARQERPGPHSPLPRTASAGGRLTISCGRRPAPHRLDRVSPRETESAPWWARIADFNLENRCERKYSSLRKKLLSRLKGPSVGPESMQGERGGGVAETLVSTLLVLAAILTAFVPFAGPSSPNVAGHTTVLLSGRALSFSSESFGLSAPVVSSAPPTGANFDYVLTIVMENKAICDILTSCNGTAPYLTSLAAASGLATHYHGTISPSLGNYLSITAASTFGCTADSLPNASACTREAWYASNLGGRLEAARLTWKAYQEAMPSNRFGRNPYPYAAKHNL